MQNYMDPTLNFGTVTLHLPWFYKYQTLWLVIHNIYYHVFYWHLLTCLPMRHFHRRFDRIVWKEEVHRRQSNNVIVITELQWTLFSSLYWRPDRPQKLYIQPKENGSSKMIHFFHSKQAALAPQKCVELKILQGWRMATCHSHLTSTWPGKIWNPNR